MNKFLTGTIAAIAVAVTVPALAADMAPRYSKAPPPAPIMIYNWTGCYIGGNVGGGWHRVSQERVALVNGTQIIPPDNFGSGDGSSFVAGGQIGYRWQSGGWVFGLEAQGDWADLRGSNVSQQFGGSSNRSKIDAFGLFTGQVGYAVNNVLLYVKGGAAVTSNSYRINTVGGALAGVTGDDTRWGGTIGAGVEVGFAPNWSAAVEYDHLFMGTNRNTFAGIVPPFAGINTRTDDIKQDADLVTVRVNYRWGGPVIAKY